MEQIIADVTLDLEGLMCPMPVVKLAQAIKTVDPGGIVIATATDPGVLADIPSWCKSTGNDLVDIHRDDTKVFHFTVRRA